MDFSRLKLATITSKKKGIIILASSSKQVKDSFIVQLYKINKDLTNGAMLSIMREIMRKNEKFIHENILHYQHIQYVYSHQLQLDDIQEGKYLVLVREYEPLVKIRWRLMTIKQKIWYFLAIAKSLQSIHKRKCEGLSINLKDIYIGPKNEIKITSIFTEDIQRMVENKAKQQIGKNLDNKQSKVKFDVWALAIVYIQIMINGRLKITWQQPQRMIASIRSFVKHSHHIFFYSIRTIINRMLKNDKQQITMSKIVEKLRTLCQLEQTEMIKRQRMPKNLSIPLLMNNPNPQANDDAVCFDNQRIIIIDMFEVFLMYNPQKQQLIIQVTNPQVAKPLLIARYFYQTLPQEVKYKYKTIKQLFHHLQKQDPRLFKISKQGQLILSSIRTLSV